MCKPQPGLEMYVMIYILAFYSAECGGLAVQALGATAADQSARLDVERTERTVCESVPSDNAAAQGNSPVGTKNQNVDYFY